MPYYLTNAGAVLDIDVPKRKFQLERHLARLASGELVEVPDDEVEVIRSEVPDPRGGEPAIYVTFRHLPSVDRDAEKAALRVAVAAERAAEAADAAADAAAANEARIEAGLTIAEAEAAAEVAAGATKEELVAELTALGVAIDGRWGVPKLAELLAEHKGA